ncbi:MAG: undecaprenyl-diphosphatase UppP [Armatimonadetes bacterium]|nr:undecaprenyl-diphosphatase UppP [Armatimonadota bacterium]
MPIFQAIILGAVQGLTEFIPVSSSGHLVVIPKLFGWAAHGKSFDAVLHLGTLAALLAYYWRDWVRIIGSFTVHVTKGKPYSKEDDAGVSGRLLVPIVVACIPAAIVGMKWGDFFDSAKVNSWYLVAIMLVVFGLLMLLGERVGKKQRDINSMGYADYLMIGFAQALALFPGVSRSGITITTGLFRNLNREAAARFSFLLSTPVVFGAGVLSIRHIDFAVIGPLPFALGLISSAGFGYAAIHFLIGFLKNKPMTAFVVYRICLAAALVGVFVLK